MNHNVSTKFIAKDFSNIGNEFDRIELGEISSEKLTDILKKVSSINSQDVTESEPQIFITNSLGQFKINYKNSKFYLSNVNDINTHDLEVSSNDAIKFLEGNEKDIEEADEEKIVTTEEKETLKKSLVANIFATLLIFSTVGFMFFILSKNNEFLPLIEYTEITNKNKILDYEKNHTGFYLTGKAQDESGLYIKEGGELEFIDVKKLTDKNIFVEQVDTNLYVFGETNNETSIIINGVEQIKLLNEDKINFDGEVYSKFPTADFKFL